MRGIQKLMVAGAALLLVACGQEEAGTSAAEDAPASEAMSEESATMSDETQGGHLPEHVAALEKQCMDATGHAIYCDCSVEAIQGIADAEHVVKSEDTEGAVTIDAPDDVHAAMDAAVQACEAQHIGQRLGEGLESHADESLQAFRAQCLAAKEHEEYCECSVDELVEHLPPDAVVQRPDGTVHIADNASTSASQAVQEAIAACEVEHIGDPGIPEPEAS